MTQKLRTEELAKMLDKALVAASRSWSPDDCAVKLYAIGDGGAETNNEITPEQRDEMLAKCVPGGPHIELDVEMLAYEQKAGERNRNSVRVRDESIMAMAATGKNKPCLKDHDHYDSESVAGRILWSRGTKVAEGHYQIRMRVRLTAPWAIELALRGLLGAVSISWENLGQILCTACNAPIRTKCWHWPGMTVSEMPQADGSKRFVWDPNGTVVVEWLYTKAGLLEVSLVPIGAVQTAGIDGIRAALAAAGFSTENLEAAALALSGSPPPEPTTEGVRMKTLEELYAAYQELSADDRAAFGAKLQAAIDAQLAADPVVHTTKDGTQIRKSDGPVALMLAKQADAAADREAKAAEALAATQAAAALAALKTRAKEQLAGMHGSDEVHVAILGAIEGIAEPMRAACLQSLAAWKAGGVARQAPGVNPETAPKPVDTLAAFNEGLAAFATKRGAKNPQEALTAFLSTPEGLALKRAHDTANGLARS